MVSVVLLCNLIHFNEEDEGNIAELIQRQNIRKKNLD